MRLALWFALVSPFVAVSQISFSPAGIAVPEAFGVHALADFNLDGRPDLAAFSNVSGALAVSVSSSSGALGPISSRFPSSLPQSVADLEAGDLNNDGRPDVVLVGITGNNKGFIDVFLGTGTGHLVEGKTYDLTGLNLGPSAIADFDRDGNLDLIVSAVGASPATSGNLYFFKGNGKGELERSSAPAITFFAAVNQLEVGDVNNDGRLDVVVVVGNKNVSNRFNLAVGLGDGGGGFAPLGSLLTSEIAECCLSLRLGDLNGDAAIDAITAMTSGEVKVWMNSGSGVFSPQTTSLSKVYGTAIGDFDLDGRNDFAYATWTDRVGFQLGAAGGTFIPSPTTVAISSDVAPLDAVDLNGDRRPDLLVGQIRYNFPAFSYLKNEFLVLLNTSPRTPVLREQQINFAAIADQVLADGSLILVATSSSNLPITFASLSDACSIKKNVVTFLAEGACSVTAFQPGDSTYAAAVPVKRTFNVRLVALQSQTITFAPLADRELSSTPFTLQATASSGLPVALSSTTASTCAVNGSSVNMLAIGTCSITASQGGDATYSPAPDVTRTFTIAAPKPPSPRIDAITNAASNIPGFLAPDSYATLYGANLSPSPTLTLRASTGAQSSLTITYSSPTQINFLLPANLALGSASLTITNANGNSQYPTIVARIAPGLFSSAGTGQGPAAANVIIVNADKSLTTRLVADGPIPVLPGTEIYLVLYGTGIRGGSNVVARVGGRPVDVLYSGAQGVYPGLDQINLRIPLTAAGLGIADIQLTVDGSPSNIVTATFQ